MRRIGHRWRIGTAWSVIVALLFHVTVLLAPAPAQSADSLGNSVVLCSSFGMYSVPLADLNGDQVPEPLQQKHSAPACTLFCPICAVGQVAVIVVPSAESIPPERLARAAVFDVGGDGGPHISLRVAGSGPRAPPKIA